MNIKTYNKSLAEQIKKSLNYAFEKQSDPSFEQTYLSNEADNIKYRVVSKAQSMVLLFYTVDVKIVFNYCGQHLKNKYYAHTKMEINKVGNEEWLQISLNTEGLNAYNQTFVAKEEKGITTGKKKYDALFEYLSKKFASIKRHFFASPYQMMLQAVKFNATSKEPKKLPNLSYNIKNNGGQRIWITFEKDQIIVYYGVSFEDRSEQQLCKILFSQLLDARKHVQNPPAIALMQSGFSNNLVQSFPQQKNNKYSFTNGIVAITIHSKILRNVQNSATYLAGFRNYIYYHIQAQKCYLHSRQLRIINNIYHNLKHTKIEPFVTK